MAHKRMRHPLADERQSAPAPRSTLSQPVAKPALQMLQSTIGNRAMQRLLQTPSPRGMVQRGFIGDLFDTVTDTISSVTDAITSIPKIVTNSSWARAGDEFTVTDADARLRTDPPALKNTGAVFPKGSNARVLESTTKDGLRYVHIEQVLEEGAYGPLLSGWTRRSNLDLSDPSSSFAPEQIRTRTPDVTAPEDIAGLPAAPPITHPAYLKVVDLLKVMEASPAPIESKHREEVGDARQQRVLQIAEARDLIAALTPAALGVSEDVFQAGIAYLNRRLRPLAPYYNQIANTNILASSAKPGWQRTCNVAVPAMLIEGLGMTRAEYDGRYGDMAFLQRIFEGLEGKYLTRKHYESAADFEALRLPDFMALIGIARKMPKGAAEFDDKKFDKAVSSARDKAAKATTAHATMVDLIEAFGATVVKSGVHAYALGQIGEARRDYTRILLGTGGDEREKKKAKYEAMDADKLLKVSTYRNSVLKAVNPLLDTGAQILVGMESHFVRLDALDEDAVQVDDPGYAILKNVRLTWQQARDLGMFKGFWSVTA